VNRRDFLGATAAAALLPIAGSRALAATTMPKVDVVVIGAGLSGLHAASLLEADGRKVMVLEGRQRVGGRVLSLDEVNGSPEAGANSMLSAYGRTLDLARGHELPLVDTTQRRSPTPAVLHIGGRTMTTAEWKDAAQNPFVGARRALPPAAHSWIEVSKANTITTSDGWSDPANAALDVSMAKFFGDRGYSPAEIRLAHDVNPGYGERAEDVSLLNWLFVDTFFKAQREAGPGEWAVLGGNQRLPEAMAKALKSEIRFGMKVVAVVADKQGVEVRCANGTRVRAAHVVCSMPLSTMRSVTFDPPLPPLHRQAVAEVPHMKITQTHFEVIEPFWESDGLSSDMWTDTDLGTLTAIRGAKDPTQVTSLAAWARGAQADRVDKLSEADGAAHVLAELERLRPAAKGKVRVAGFKSWQKDEFALGDWVVWKPGQPMSLPKACGTAHGAIHFCGEHTALANRGMEGALESGERAALEIIAP
jgi:monoamine oxidase